MDTAVTYIGLDVETTGVEEDAQLLELGMIAYSESFDEVDSFTTLVLPAEVEQLYRSACDVAQDMHARNGLWQELAVAERDPDRSTTLTLYSVEKRAIDWISGLEMPDRPRLFGSSVSFDRDILRRFLPVLSHWFHYQIVDATSFHIMATSARKCCGEDERYSHHVTAHRALADIRQSRELMFAAMDTLAHQWPATRNTWKEKNTA